MIVLGIIGGVVLLALLVGLYVWTRRSERDIEIPTRDLSDEERRTRMLERGVANNSFFNGNGGF